MLSELAMLAKAEFQRNDLLCNKVIGLFQLVSNKTRFRIICLLVRGEFCVNEIVEVVSEGKGSNISQQLRVLSLAGVVARRREKKRILYRLADERVRGLIGFLRDQFLNPNQI